jgi:signal transduction histidine kinase
MAEAAPRRRRGSVRARTTLLATLVSGLALVAGSVLLLVTLDASLHRAGDDLARGRVRDLAALAGRGGLPTVLTSIDGEGVGQVFSRDGRVLAASANISGRPPVTVDARSQVPVMRLLRDAPDDTEAEDYRVWTAAAPSPQGPVTVVAGASLESVSEASSALRRDLVAGVPLLVLLVAGGTWTVVGRTLRPVEDIRTEVAAISELDLGRRVPVPPTDDEVGRLAVTMNDMLDRLQDGSRRQRDFVADASHELQSPLTALRSQLEAALGGHGEAWPEAARPLLADTAEMERLVHDLLFLARTSEVTVRSRRLLDLDDVVIEEVARIRPTTSLTVSAAEVSAAPVVGDREDLRRLVRNLLENAVQHATGMVGVRLVTEGDTVRMDVVDDGPGVPAADRARVFDRFFRSDGSRSRGSGSGLGLAIARSIAESHGGTLRVEQPGPSGEVPTGADLVLRLPAAVRPGPRTVGADDVPHTRTRADLRQP